MCTPPAARRAFGRTGPPLSTATAYGKAYSDVPIIIGGLEASLRRFSHYDYWEDKVRHSTTGGQRRNTAYPTAWGKQSILDCAAFMRDGAAPGEASYASAAYAICKRTSPRA